MTQLRPFTTTKPPPVESLGKAYFTPLMTIPVVTRKPEPAPNADIITEYLRLESAGGAQQVQAGLEGYFWRVSIILHSYAPQDSEALAEESIGDALGWGANAKGLTLTTKTGVEWYVTDSAAPVLGTKLEDPRVQLVRYRGMVTWLVQGRQLQ